MTENDYAAGSLATLLVGYLTDIPYQPDPPSVKFISYKEYLLTDHWQLVRGWALRYYGSKCNVCSDRRFLDVHHNNYNNLWGELMTDLTVLCHGCHGLFHSQLPEEPSEVINYA